jgi:quercetin dioxygenase-like cupin family protein
MLEPQIKKLIDLVAYQKDSVVSREVIFAFDEGQGLSEHTAPFDALVNVIDGEVKIVISGKEYHLKEGEMIIMPANEPHALKALKQFKMVLTMIRS